MLIPAQRTAAINTTWVYAVQISAQVQATPPQITLNWKPDQYGATNYTIYRKAKEDQSWGAPVCLLSGAVSNYIDTNVIVGATYEYQITKKAIFGYTGYGYIYAGIEAPLNENRGKLLLIIATNSTEILSNELGRLKNDLIGDGWTVLRHDVSSNDAPIALKTIISNEFYADPNNVKTLFLLGPVPVAHSGYLNYDGHYFRQMPADSFYADVRDDWSLDPSNSPSYLPSDVELMVGRVDLSNMPGDGAPVPWPNETELLRNYLNKDHNWRHRLATVSRRALMGNRRGDENGEATATSGYRNFEPLVGPGTTVEANVEDDAPADQRWIALLSANSYLWAYGCGGGEPSALSALGTNGIYDQVWSTDIVGQDAKAVFVMLFGSYFGNWDDTDNLMRSVLATPSLGLACCMAGRPHWFFHHMGLGETIGYSTRLTMNNSTLYQNESNGYPRAVYVGLMGDPTLRLDPVAPPSGLSALAIGNRITLGWFASPDDVLGYYVYRGPTSTGPFSRLTDSLATTTVFTDTNITPGNYTYMVRAIKLQTTPSGTYLNPSQGIFLSVSTTPSTVPILVTSWYGPKGAILNWNSEPGKIYHVLALSQVASKDWIDVSGAIVATGSPTTWTNGQSAPAQRFYRIREE
jgi:hypothetical protein